MDIKWTDSDPVSGGRRYVKAEHFAGKWQFFTKLERRVEWQRDNEPTREMWEYLLDSLEAKYRYRDGVDERAVEVVRKILATWKEKPSIN